MLADLFEYTHTLTQTVDTALPEREPDIDVEDMDAMELPVPDRRPVDVATAGERPSPIVLLRSRTVMSVGVCVRRSLEEEDSIEGLCDCGRGAKEGWEQTWVSVSAQCV